MEALGLVMCIIGIAFVVGITSEPREYKPPLLHRMIERLAKWDVKK